MFGNMDEMQKLSKEAVEAALKSMGAMTKAMQAIAVESTDFSKKVFEKNAALGEQLIGSKTPEDVLKACSGYLQSSQKDFVAMATKVGELSSEVAKEASKPLEGVLNGSKKAA
jgi:hypothetical protein